jgi:hypothetical protein
MTRPFAGRMIASVALAGAFMAPSAAFAQKYRIDHLEPPFWWAGMQHQSLQLMVHGPGIADLAPSLDYPGVRIGAVTRVANRNYLFIDLAVSREAAPGSFDILFGKGAVKYRYQLMAREPGSAQRAGFNTADAIYQVMPDRFANGAPANDSVAALAEKADRNNPSGRHGGDIQGIIDRLDYIAGMGFTQLWPTPLVENDMPD